MLKDLSPEQRMLANVMSDISERCYSAGWMHDLEYVLWDSVLSGEKLYGRDKITAQDVAQLKTLSQKANCWIVFGDNEETAIDLKKWGAIFADHQ